MSIAETMLIGWCIDWLWDCDDALLDIIEPVIQMAESRWPELSVMLVW